MKIAKKLLAAVVAVMLVLSLSVCAFATQSADTGRVEIESDWVIDELGTIAVYVYFIDATELQSWDLKLNYDAAMFDYDAKSDGKDAKNIKLYCNPDKNTYTDDSNPNVDGEVKVGGYFKEVLWDADTFAANANRGETLTVNSDRFNASIFYLKVVDVEGFEQNGTTISISGGMAFGAKGADGDTSGQTNTTVSDSITKAPIIDPTTTEPEVTTTEPEVTTTEPEVTTTEPEVTTTEPEVTTTEVNATRPPFEDEDDDCRPGKPGHDNCKPGKPVCKPGKPGKPNHKHPDTGDSAALAAAAGVVLLAGAAFVVSKKRK